MTGSHSECDGQLDLLAALDETDSAAESADSSSVISSQDAAAPVHEPSTTSTPRVDDPPAKPMQQVAEAKAVVEEKTVAPASTAADGHALIVLADRVITPSGRKVLGALNSIERLEKLLLWSVDHLTSKGTSLQIWIVGPEVLEAIGWAIDPADKAFAKAKNDDEVNEIARQLVDDRINASVSAHFDSEWTATVSGFRVHFKRDSARRGQTRHVDLILESYVQLLSQRDNLGILGERDGATSLPDDNEAAAAELGRRIGWWVEHIGTLPSFTGANAGAALRDQIARNRTTGTSGRARKVASTTEPSPESPNPMPPLFGAHDILEPEVRWRRRPTRQEVAAASTIQIIDQRASYLASAGMLSFGYGEPVHVDASAAEERLRATKATPFGLWHIELPAAASLNLPEQLPFPHPYMQEKAATDAWVTSVSLDALCAPVADGGAGLSFDDLALSEAWVWPKQGRTLATWAKTLREARSAATAAGDAVMKSLVGDVYKGYVGRMANPEMWSSEWMRHHHQPTWRSSIIAHARQRSRRAAMRIHDEFGLWPIRSITDSWTYLVPEGITIGDSAPELGKLVEESRVELSAAAKKRLSAASYDDLPEVLKEILNNG